MYVTSNTLLQYQMKKVHLYSKEKEWYMHPFLFKNHNCILPIKNSMPLFASYLLFYH